MRTNEERQQLIHRRTLEIQREQQKKRERVISGSGIAACLMIIIGIGCLVQKLIRQQEWLVCWEIMRHLDTFVWEFWHLHLVFV